MANSERQEYKPMPAGTMGLAEQPVAPEANPELTRTFLDNQITRRAFIAGAGLAALGLVFAPKDTLALVERSFPSKSELEHLTPLEAARRYGVPGDLSADHRRYEILSNYSIRFHGDGYLHRFNVKKAIIDGRITTYNSRGENEYMRAIVAATMSVVDLDHATLYPLKEKGNHQQDAANRLRKYYAIINDVRDIEKRRGKGIIVAPMSKPEETYTTPVPNKYVQRRGVKWVAEHVGIKGTRSGDWRNWIENDWGGYNLPDSPNNEADRIKMLNGTVATVAGFWLKGRMDPRGEHSTGTKTDAIPGIGVPIGPGEITDILANGLTLILTDQKHKVPQAEQLQRQQLADENATQKKAKQIWVSN